MNICILVLDRSSRDQPEVRVSRRAMIVYMWSFIGFLLLQLFYKYLWGCRWPELDELAPLMYLMTNPHAQ